MNCIYFFESPRWIWQAYSDEGIFSTEDRSSQITLACVKLTFPEMHIMYIAHQPLHHSIFPPLFPFLPPSDYLNYSEDWFPAQKSEKQLTWNRITQLPTDIFWFDRARQYPNIWQAFWIFTCINMARVHRRWLHSCYRLERYLEINMRNNNTWNTK